jgi:hypothetical protein
MLGQRSNYFFGHLSQCFTPVVYVSEEAFLRGKRYTQEKYIFEMTRDDEQQMNSR